MLTISQVCMKQTIILKCSHAFIVIASSDAQVNLKVMQLFVQCLVNYCKVKVQVSTCFPVLSVIFLSASMEELLAHMNNYHSDNLVVIFAAICLELLEG